jgi:hypothetical protein
MEIRYGEENNEGEFSGCKIIHLTVRIFIGVFDEVLPLIEMPNGILVVFWLDVISKPLSVRHADLRYVAYSL